MDDNATSELRKRIGKNLSPIANEALDDLLDNHQNLTPEQMLCHISLIVTTAYFGGFDRGYQRGFKMAKAKDDNNV